MYCGCGPRSISVSKGAFHVRFKFIELHNYDTVSKIKVINQSAAIAFMGMC